MRNSLGRPEAWGTLIMNVDEADVTYRAARSGLPVLGSLPAYTTPRRTSALAPALLVVAEVALRQRHCDEETDLGLTDPRR